MTFVVSFALVTMVALYRAMRTVQTSGLQMENIIHSFSHLLELVPQMEQRWRNLLLRRFCYASSHCFQDTALSEAVGGGVHTNVTHPKFREDVDRTKAVMMIVKMGVMSSTKKVSLEYLAAKGRQG